MVNISCQSANQGSNLKRMNFPLDTPPIRLTTPIRIRIRICISIRINILTTERPSKKKDVREVLAEERPTSPAEGDDKFFQLVRPITALATAWNCLEMNQVIQVILGLLGRARLSQ